MEGERTGDAPPSLSTVLPVPRGKRDSGALLHGLLRLGECERCKARPQRLTPVDAAYQLVRKGAGSRPPNSRLPATSAAGAPRSPRRARPPCSTRQPSRRGRPGARRAAPARPFLPFTSSASSPQLNPPPDSIRLACSNRVSVGSSVSYLGDHLMVGIVVVDMSIAHRVLRVPGIVAIGRARHRAPELQRAVFVALRPSSPRARRNRARLARRSDGPLRDRLHRTARKPTASALFARETRRGTAGAQAEEKLRDCCT